MNARDKRRKLLQDQLSSMPDSLVEELRAKPLPPAEHPNELAEVLQKDAAAKLH